ncbi:hypothetical protein T492DRAFT_844389 [Pavlovales sp. CCMP2436]|nr:hypothetical protein T492DRAFT_844389 [Pavlovales sp. CCMP2436]
MSKDHYTLLGLGREATEAQIKAKYRLLAKRYHPDLNPGCKTSEETFKHLTVAYNQAVGEAKVRATTAGRAASAGRGRGPGAGPMPTGRGRYSTTDSTAGGASAHYDAHEWNRAHYQSEDFYDSSGSRRWNVNGQGAESVHARAQRNAEMQAAYRAARAGRTWNAPPARPFTRKPPALILVAIQVTGILGVWAYVASTWGF